MHPELLAGTPSEPVLLGSECRRCGTVSFPRQNALPALHVDRRQPSAGSPAAARSGAGRSSASARSPRPTPGPEAFEPYGVGYIELPGEVRVEARLTESDPAKLRIGMEMELTLIPEGATFAFRPRAAMSDDVAVIGLGIHPFGRHPGVSGLEMAAHAARAALADAGLGWDEIDFAAGGSDAAGNADTTVSVLGLTGVPVHQRQERLRDRRLGADHGARDADRGQRRDRARGRLRQAPAGRLQPAARGVGHRLLVRRDRADADDAVLRA